MQTKVEEDHHHHHHIMPSWICLVILLFGSVVVNAAGIPRNNALAFSCGSSDGGTDSDGRKWDSDSEFHPTPPGVVAKAEAQDPSLPSDVPYMTARIFTSETAYEFPNPNPSSRVLLRFHFYPASYPGFDITNSYFSVEVGGFTLLSNFSAYITAEALSQGYLIREYFLAPIDYSTIRVTFKPESSNSFAFVNGIEVITPPDMFDQDAPLVGVGSQEDTATDTHASFGRSQNTMSIAESSMQTMFRINAGGHYISAINDSAGLMRAWYDDTPYIYGGALGVSLEDEGTPIGYKKLPSYIAPLDVYRTARSMGPSPEVNKNYNLTWVFQVDANFSYLVRFHWCDWEFDKLNQRAFSVILNNQTAVEMVDIFGWTNEKATPIKKDYVVHVANQPGSDVDVLKVELHPITAEGSQYADSILNGLEIFKLSDSKSNLAGANPAMSDLMRKYLESEENPKAFSQKKGYSGALIGGAAGGAAAFGVVAAIVFIVARSRKKRRFGSEVGGNSWLPIYGTSHSSGSKSNPSHGSTTISSDAACNCRYFSLAEIKQATKNFDESHVIGVGGFGKVYKGVIDGDIKVAVKRSNPSSEQGVNEFQTEIEMLSKLRHRHLVSLIGFCEENNEMVLVYDYMGKGTLREHLYKGNKIVLSWKQRLEICIGAARGLHYLHTGAKYTIIHRDVKTTNILVDDKWVAKVSDFGLSKTGPNMNQGHVSTVVKGSFGYLDPEYFRRQQLTEKSDVYSFGVVLFEVLCARPALNPSLPKEQVSLADWAMHCQRKGNLEDIIDPQLKGKISPECLKKFTDTAQKCLADHGIDRPSMGDVLWNLEYALQLQENPDGGGRASASEDGDVVKPLRGMDHSNFLAMHRMTLSLGSDTDDIGDGSEEKTEDIFSQIVNPQGR